MSTALKITWKGQSWLTDDLTLAEAVQIEEETGESWRYINPLRSAKHCQAILRRFVARTNPAEVAEVDAMSMRDAVAAVEVVEDDLPDQFDNGVPVDPKG